MKRNKWLIAQGALLLLAVVAVSSTSLALYVKSAESNGPYGEVNLRSYFHAGDGKTPETAYTITRPQHMYNLSRLQSLGVFKNDGTTYFKLGEKSLDTDPEHDTYEEKIPYCYGPNDTLVQFLDMSDSSYAQLPIVAIGSEAMPFVDYFDGQNVEIKDLTVYADPEDAGLFGYTAHGSVVENLFLDNITVNSLGYTKGYDDLYGSSSTAENGISDGVNLHYEHVISASETVDQDFVVYPSKTSAHKTANFDVSDYLLGDYTAVPAAANTPTVVASWPDKQQYNYKLLGSGDFLDIDGQNVTVNLAKVYDFFAKKAGKKALGPGDEIAAKWPLKASSSVSIVCSRVDKSGLTHSRVIETLQFNFTMASSSATSIALDVRLGADHGNNIGLIVGHCDGTVRNCYVHDGEMNMNNNGGNDPTVTGSYTALAHGSSGLIGLVGSTVHDMVSDASAAGTRTGLDIGVLDFTEIYDDIIIPKDSPLPYSAQNPNPNASFRNPESIAGGVKYYPNPTTQYMQWLRYDSLANKETYRVTKAEDYVSFVGKQVIWTQDLGIFNIVTDQSSTGVEGSVGSGFSDTNPVSTIHKESHPVNYLYYSTGEYSKGSGISFDEYRDAMETDTPSQFLLGHHFPKTDELSVEGFKEREMHQNYFFRFEMQKNYRENTNPYMYFADVNAETPGGSFLSKYFEYKLVDSTKATPEPIPAGDERCGVMFRDADGFEIGSFSSSFITKDFSDPTQDRDKMYVLDDAEAHYPVANSVNFEITTPMANVTVVAAPNEEGKSAALGVYNTEIDGEYPTIGSSKYLDTNYEDPDYAFFMPSDDHLAYFDYKPNGQNVGEIGVYTDSSTFVQADEHTDATVPNQSAPGGEKKTIENQPRLFVHTFKLPAGRYCLGAASGTKSDAGDGVQTIPKIYYICAHGQVEGQLQFNDNGFASSDVIEDVDFLKVPRFTYNRSTGVTTHNITFGPDSAYSPSSTLLQHQRCYVDLAKAKVDRSYFLADASDLSFQYTGGKMAITSSTQNKISHLSVSTYAEEVNGGSLTGLTNTVIAFLDQGDKNKNPIVYDPS